MRAARHIPLTMIVAGFSGCAVVGQQRGANGLVDIAARANRKAQSLARKSRAPDENPEQADRVPGCMAGLIASV